jgi:hypothetical protein
VDREIMSERQTFRAKTIVTASEKAVAVVPLRNVEQNKGGQPSTEKDFETQLSGVFAPPGLPLAHFQLRNPGSTIGRHVRISCLRSLEENRHGRFISLNGD